MKSIFIRDISMFAMSFLSYSSLDMQRNSKRSMAELKAVRLDLLLTPTAQSTLVSSCIEIPLQIRYERFCLIPIALTHTVLSTDVVVFIGPIN